MSVKWWLDEYPEPFDVSLVRDSFKTPWGFRIAGGLDFGQTPIVVTQVNACSPAENELQIGDVIISVDHQQVFRRRHFDVLSMLSKEAGGTLKLQLYRGITADQIKSRSGFNIRFHAPPNTNFPVSVSSSWHPSSDNQGSSTLDRPNAMYRQVPSGPSGRPTTISLRKQNPPPPQQQYYNPQQDEYMLRKVQSSLDTLNFGRAPHYQHQPEYSPTSPAQYLQQFHRPAAPQHRPRSIYAVDYSAPRPPRSHSVGPGPRAVRGMTPSSYSAFIRPRSSMGQPHTKTPEFCWMPKGFKPRRGYSQPTRNPPGNPGQYSSYQPIETPQSVTLFTRPEDDANYVPPWKGTLHSASPSAWIEGQMIDPDNPIYHRHHRQREPPPPAEPLQVIETSEADDGRKVVHLQYNSPLALYSGDEARHVLAEQTAAQNGPEGTIIIKGGRPGAVPQKITQSETYQMVQEEDRRRQRRQQRPRPQSFRQAPTPSDPNQPVGQGHASAEGQLRVVLTQPSQRPPSNNYFYGGHNSNNYYPTNQNASGFSDF